jgi:hypothetical protein
MRDLSRSNPAPPQPEAIASSSAAVGSVASQTPDRRTVGPAVALESTAVYSAGVLAAILGISRKTLGRLERSSQIPAGFALGGRRYWLGHVLIEHFDRLQAAALEEARLL